MLRTKAHCRRIRLEPQKSGAVDEAVGTESPHTGEKAYAIPPWARYRNTSSNAGSKPESPTKKWLTDVTELKGEGRQTVPLANLGPVQPRDRRLRYEPQSRQRNGEGNATKKPAPRLTDKGTMLHSDQGVPYRTAGYRELLAEHSMVQSMSRKANCWTMRRWKASLRC